MTRRSPNLEPIGTALVTVMVALATACGGEEITVGGPPPAPVADPSTTTTAATPDPAAAPEGEAAPAAAPTAPTYRDEDFVEADTNRDPFRNFAFMFVPRTTGPVRTQRHVLMDNTSVDEMRLIAIISGVANPSAMLLDGSGTGHTVHRGDYVGRVEYVSTGGADSVPISLNWRVERISATEVVLSREDPSSAAQVGLTRVLPLHDPAVEGT